MATFEQSMKKMFKVGETYTGSIASYNPQILVKFACGGMGLMESKSVGFPPLETEVEITIIGFNKDGIPLLVLTADCCNRLKIPVVTRTGEIGAKSNSAVLIQTFPDNYFVAYMPYMMTYEDEILTLKDIVRFVEMEEECSSIYALLEKIVPVPEGLEIDTAVRVEAERYASLLHRNGLHLGATYTGMATKNKGAIGKVLVDIINKNVDCLSDNVKLKIINIPPKGSRAIEAVLIE